MENHEPTATEVAAYAAMKLAEWASYVIIVVVIAGFWVGTPR